MQAAPSPWLTPLLARPPACSDRGREGEGSCHRRKKEARLLGEARRWQVSCAAARPSPPDSGSWPIKPPNYAWPGAPSALPPQEDTINVRGGRAGRAGRRWLTVASPRAGGAGWKGRGLVGEAGCRRGPGVPKGRGAAPGTPCGTRAAQGGAGTAGKAPGTVTGVARVLRRGVREVRAAPAPCRSSAPPASSKAIVCRGSAAKGD